MLQETFYKIISEEQREDTHIVHAELNKNHAIYEGHFPDNPVVPGVCQTQIIKEVLETIAGMKLRMTLAAEIKYLAVINPRVDPDLVIELKIKRTDDNSFSVNSTIGGGDKIFLKFRGTFVPE